MAENIARTATGNTPSGNPGAGTRETTSAPDPVGSTAPRSASTAPVPAGDGSLGAAPSGPVGDAVFGDDDFKRDGTLKKDAVRRIKESGAARAGERSYNEVTGQTTVTTVVGGRTVTFVEDGDTREED